MWRRFKQYAVWPLNALETLFLWLLGPTWSVRWIRGAALPSSLSVTLTESDIEQGVWESHTQCPVALAANRALHEAVPLTDARWIASVESELITFTDRLTSLDIGHYWLPEPVRDVVARFDAGEAVTQLDFVAPRVPGARRRARWKPEDQASDEVGDKVADFLKDHLGSDNFEAGIRRN
jgi:hypothetical protein